MEGERSLFIFQPEIGTGKLGKSDQFSRLISVLRDERCGNFSIIIDESHELQRPQAINPELDWLMRQAPRDGPAEVTVIQTTHAPQDLNRTVHRLVSDVFLFNCRDSMDQKRYEEQFGEKIANLCMRLKSYEVVHLYDDSDGTDLRRVYSIWRQSESATWNVPIGGTQSQSRANRSNDGDGPGADGIEKEGTAQSA
jgi:hypothetical protein